MSPGMVGVLKRGNDVAPRHGNTGEPDRAVMSIVPFHVATFRRLVADVWIGLRSGGMADIDLALRGTGRLLIGCERNENKECDSHKTHQDCAPEVNASKAGPCLASSW